MTLIDPGSDSFRVRCVLLVQVPVARAPPDPWGPITQTPITMDPLDPHSKHNHHFALAILNEYGKAN